VVLYFLVTDAKLHGTSLEGFIIYSCRCAQLVPELSFRDDDHILHPLICDTIPNSVYTSGIMSFLLIGSLVSDVLKFS
jgi:hypothetical protein